MNNFNKGLDEEQTQKYIFLGFVLEKAGKIRSFHDDRLQNLVYRVQHDIGKKYFNFDGWHLGPYSHELDKFIFAFNFNELIKFNKVSEFEEDVELSYYGKLTLKILYSKTEEYFGNRKSRKALIKNIRKNNEVDMKRLIEENTKSWIAEQPPEKQTESEKCFIKIKS